MSDDIYKILSKSLNTLKEQDADDFGLDDVEMATPGGNEKGRLAPPEGDDTKPPGPPSDKPNTDDQRPPQPGTTDQTSAGRDAGEEATPVDTSGSGETVSPETDPEPGDSAEASPETPEDSAGLPGQTGVFTADDFIIPDGARVTKIATLNAKIETDNGSLTIINRGISPDSDFMDPDPQIVYTVVSTKGGEEKRKNVNIPYSSVSGAGREKHFAAVMNHLKGTHTKAIAGDTAPELPDGGGAP